MNSSLKMNKQFHRKKNVVEQSMVKNFLFPSVSGFFFLCLSQKFKEHHITLELIVTIVDIDNFFHRILSICCLSVSKRNFSFFLFHYPPCRRSRENCEWNSIEFVLWNGGLELTLMVRWKVRAHFCIF